ncbi:hypothetical protein [Paenibacillus gallinarum]|uniref:NEAT domain-containing protein n=1 Tax=Paenibacillus gallinarum TaxID=2762232 RepID=A0ABR8T0P1_9BACL|nr:hypothetical protein [Paenibacillus gallinarum]MBD7969306.1 hypothetical protein [Paenibacillus gallinarum]
MSGLKGGEILYNVKRLLFVVILFIVTLLNTGEAFAESYPRAIALNNYVYLVSGVEIDINNIGKEIGKIERQRDPMPKKNGESNDTPVGSLIFEIKDINTEDMVAVKIDNKFYFASQKSSIQSISGKTLLPVSIFSLTVLIVVVFWIRSRKH